MIALSSLIHPTRQTGTKSQVTNNKTYLFEISRQSDIDRRKFLTHLRPYDEHSKILCNSFVIEMKNTKPRLIIKSPNLIGTRTSFSCFNTIPKANVNDVIAKVNSLYKFFSK